MTVARSIVSWGVLLASVGVAAVAAYLLFAGAPPPLLADGTQHPRMSIARVSPGTPTDHQVTVRPLSSSVDPASIHDWVVQVSDAGGVPVAGCRVGLDASMPEHGHGLPTEPRVEGEQPRGTYRVGGVRFSMPGYWLMTIKVRGCGPPQRIDLELRF